ncbi:hypothetical protein JOC37_002500 [Desulfohalotomaculum tongense]|nr:hypothetical protein [Desulforadius tongensis]
MYTEDSSVAEQLHNLNNVKLVTVYRHVKKTGILAMQFTFYGGDDYNTLSEVCSLTGLEFKRVLAMGKRGEYLPYSRKFYPDGEQIQLRLDQNTVKSSSIRR